jgi:hypothetical protein
MSAEESCWDIPLSTPLEDGRKVLLHLERWTDIESSADIPFDELSVVGARGIDTKCTCDPVTIVIGGSLTTPSDDWTVELLHVDQSCPEWHGSIEHLAHSFHRSSRQRGRHR